MIYPGVYFDLLCSPIRTFFHGYQIVQLDPLNAKKIVPQISFGLDYAKMHGVHGNA